MIPIINTHVIKNSAKIWLLALAFLMLAGNKQALAQPILEGFDDVNMLTANGWFMQNNSSPAGDGWYNGDPTAFPAYNGAAESYILAYSGNVLGTGTISNWLLTPVRTLRNGDVVSFYTRKVAPEMYPDRLQLRMSTSGTSTNVGNTATSVGDFSTLLLDINPTLVQGVYPTIWTQYSVTISGLANPVSGRFALRYFVTNGGPTGVNSELIGIDQFDYVPDCPIITISPAALPQPQAGVAYTQTLTQTGATGAVNYAVTAGALPAGLTLSAAGIISGTPTIGGTYTFTVTATDANFCSASVTYSFIICPAITINPASLAPAIYGQPYSQPLTQTGGSGPVTFSVSAGNLPVGLSLNAAGVISGTPLQTGSYSVTVTVTDVNGCEGIKSYIIFVNCNASFSPLQPVCSNSGPVTLTGGSPAGGVYSGTGVSGGVFSPSAGTQLITYTYTGPDGCNSSAYQTQHVNTVPTVTLPPFQNVVCLTSGPVLLPEGSPAGGTFSGPGISNGEFTPTTTGVFPITYTVTNNGCSASATQDLTVDICSGIKENDLPAASLICFPNPTTGKITVRYQLPAKADLQLLVYSAYGVLVKALNQTSAQGLFQKDIYLESLPKGMYLIEIRLNGTTISYQKILLK